MKSSRRWVKVAKFIAYPFFYLFCLGFFGYLTFPWNQLKDRIISEFNKSQRKTLRRPGDKPMRLEIDDLDSYWFTGVEITGARLIIPPKPKKKSRRRGLGSFGGGDDDKAEPPPKDAVVRLDTLIARAQILSLLTGDVVINFSAEAFGGTIEGTVPVGPTGDDVEVEFEGLQLLEIEPLQQVLEGVPLQGVADGSVKLTPKEGKFERADGAVNIAINAVKLGKKTKNEESGEMEDVVEIQGIRIPSVALGTINLALTAKDGGLKLADLSAKSADFELLGEGTIKLNELWDRSRAEMFLKFKFTDEYKLKSPAATSLLGKPGATNPLIELGSPDIKRSKTSEGFYRFRIHGPLGNLSFDPAGDGGARRPGTKRKTTTRPRPRPRPRTRPIPKPSGDDDEPPKNSRPSVDGEPPTPRRRRPAPRPRTPVAPPPADPEPEAPPEPDEPTEPAGPEDGEDPPEDAPEDPPPDEGDAEGPG